MAHREETARTKRRMYMDWDYWGKPLPAYGDPNARLLIVGLAPAAHGGNRTGRMFTGDRSGDWVYGTLYKFGFSSSPDSHRRDDGLVLTDAYITAALRCAPPANKPLREERLECLPYLVRELELSDQHVSVVVALGKIAFDTFLDHAAAARPASVQAASRFRAPEDLPTGWRGYVNRVLPPQPAEHPDRAAYARTCSTRYLAPPENCWTSANLRQGQSGQLPQRARLLLPTPVFPPRAMAHQGPVNDSRLKGGDFVVRRSFHLI